MTRRIAVIGSGISGLTAAYLLRRTDTVTVYEADDRLGGHSHTHDVPLPDGTSVTVDSGFIVHNHRTYPNLLRLFAELDIATQPTEMSMSIHCDGCGLEYAGGRGAGGILAQPRNLRNRQFVGMLTDVRRFHRLAHEFLTNSTDEDLSLGDWLRQHNFTDYFVAHFAIPLVACVWSSGHETALDYPARYLFTFLDHHGMLTVTGSPQWYTVTGGSARYVEKLAATLPDVRLSDAVTRVARTADGVVVESAQGTETYDHVIIATHGPTAASLVAEPTDTERDILGAFTGTTNRVMLHTNASRLPRASRAKAAWNYRMNSCDARDASPSVTYWMNRLHELPTTTPLLVTLDQDHSDLAASDIIASMTYEHPRYTRESVAAARRIEEICDDQISYAGAHLGWGFHEDGCRSGVRAAERLGVTW